MLYRQPPFEQKKLENNIQKNKKISILRHVSLLSLPNKMLYLRHATSILLKVEHMVWRVKEVNCQQKMSQKKCGFRRFCVISADPGCATFHFASLLGEFTVSNLLKPRAKMINSLQSSPPPNNDAQWNVAQPGSAEITQKRRKPHFFATFSTDSTFS